MNSWKIILATVVIFGAGVVTGGLLVNYVQHGHPGWRHADAALHNRPGARELPIPRAQLLNQEFVEKLDVTLHLTPEQRRKIEKIIAQGQERNHDLWRLVTPQFRAVMQDVHQRIRAVLTPEQQKQFQELVRQFASHPSPRRQEPPASPPRTNTVHSPGPAGATGP